MQTASFNGVLKTIFYFIAFYYVFKFLARVFLPIMVKKVVEKAGESFQQQQNQYNNQKAHNKEEFVNTNSNSSKPKETKKVGEYVDYEELE